MLVVLRMTSPTKPHNRVGLLPVIRRQRPRNHVRRVNMPAATPTNPTNALQGDLSPRLPPIPTPSH